MRSERRDWQNDEIAGVLLERLGQMDPQEVATLAAQMDEKQVAGAMTALLPELAAINPAAAMKLYKQMSEAERAAFPAEDFIKVLATVDLEAAKEVVALCEPDGRGRSCGFIVRGLSAQNPAGAIAFLKSLPDGELAGAMSDLKALSRIAAHNLAETAQLLERLPTTNEASSNFARLAEVWVAEDSGKALAWADSIEFEANCRAESAHTRLVC